MAKDYYLILGVPLDAAPDAIRSAFRKLALRYHPDRRGPSGRRAFEDVSEAYGVLSDPVKRARYDRELRREIVPVRVEPAVSRAAEPEPLNGEPLDFELILSPEEAGRGVRVPFEVPVLCPCYRCGGTGRDWWFLCGDCAGQGRLVDRETFHVRVPAGVRDGAVLETSLEHLGIHNLWLRVQVRLARH